MITKLKRPTYFLLIICGTVLATEAYFSYQHGKLHEAAQGTFGQR